MSLIVDKELVINEVMEVIQKHYSGYEHNINEMESILTKRPNFKMSTFTFAPKSKD